MATTAELISGNIFIRKHALVKDEQIVGHTHHFDHTSIVHTGSVSVRAVLPSGQVIERTFAAPDHFLVRADVEHTITALEPTLFWCVYSHRDPQGRVSQQATGWPEAYL